MNRSLAIVLLLAVLGALALRLPQLDRRPLHNDEAVNAFKLQGLLEKGEFKYDPYEYHGPSLYYFSLPFLWLGSVHDNTQMDDAKLRWPTVCFGVALIALLWWLRDGLGHTAVAAAAILTAISPAFVFYSRYLIHEILLVFFTLLFLIAAWRYCNSRKPAWAILAGVALGLMYATKETFVLAVAAAFGAWIANLAWAHWREQQPLKIGAWWNWRHAALALVAFAAVDVLLFSSFFTNARGPWDAILTYLTYFKRGAGGEALHVHPWHFYFERLLCFHVPKGPFWSEAGIVVLAIFGGAFALGKRSIPGVEKSLARFLVFYTVLLTAVYCVIGYKTPWCCLGFLHGMILLAGIGVAGLAQALPRRAARASVGLVLALLAVHLGWQAYAASYPYAADRKNPYVYAQTQPDVFRLLERVRGMAAVHPQKEDMVIKVISRDSYWPLPWYLRGYRQTGWWDSMPADPYAPVAIVDSQFNALLDEKSGHKYIMAGLYQLRPQNKQNPHGLELYVELEAWKKYVATLPKDEE